MRRTLPTLPTLLLLHLLLLLRDIGLSGVTAASSSSSTTVALTNSYCEADDTGNKILKTSYVSDTEQATQLAQDLLRCPGEDFEVEWHGTIAINRSLEITNGSSLKITGQRQQGRATIEAEGIETAFVVRESSLQLDGLTITGASGIDGGVVAAWDGASVRFVNCSIHGNTASSYGGAVFLNKSSSFSSAGSNFTNNNAGFGGAVFAGDGSTVLLQNNSTNLLYSNTARYGGAVYLEEGSTFTLGDGQTELLNNSAEFWGGAIYAETDCEVTIAGTSMIAENVASNGGAIFAKEGTVVTTSGNNSFVDNYSGHLGGAIMVSDASKVHIAGKTNFCRNSAEYDGGAIEAETDSIVRIRGRTSFVENSAGDFGGAISASNSVKLSTGGRTRFYGNSASSGGAVYSTEVVTVLFQGKTLFENNTAHNDGGALHLMFAEVSLIDSSKFYSNQAEDGSGGALYCNNVDKLTVISSKFKENAALWGGAVATFSSGGQPATTTTSDSSSLFTTTSSTTISSTANDSLSSTSSSSTASPVKFVDCWLDSNHAGEDGGAIYSVSGYDIIRRTNFTNNCAESSGGGLVHGGVLAEVSNSIFALNRAGNEGPAILSLGLLRSLSEVTFRDNYYYCEAGKFSSTTSVDSNSCRFTEVCSRCTAECGSELEDGSTIEDLETLPTCEDAPDGSTTTTRGSTVETLEILPGHYRPSATSLDVRECLYADACLGGIEDGEYCAAGYGGPYCAVCLHGYAPGYHHTCKSCIGGSKRRAVAGITIVLCIITLALGFAVASLVSVVKSTPARTQENAGDSTASPVEANDPEEGEMEKPGGGTPKTGLSNRVKETLGVWQHRVVKRFPLTVVKIIVVVWQIVTQYSDVAGVKYPGAYKEFLSIIDMVNLDVGFILSFACVYDTTFYDRLLFATLGPIVVLALLGCTYMIALRRNRGCQVALTTVRQRHLSVALFVMFVVYGTVSHAIFETFVCDDMESGDSYLRADYSLDCTTGRHASYRVYAAFMVVIYPVGIPCLFGWWLFNHRQLLRADPHRHSNPSLRPAADLWEPYKRDRYYYEVVECFRRIALTGLAVFIYPESSAQIAVVLMLAAIFMVVSEILCPFVRPVEMWLYRAGHYVVFAGMYLALLLRVDISSERTQSQEVFSGVLVIAHAAMVLVVVVQGVLVFMGWGDLLEAPVALQRLEIDEGSLAVSEAPEERVLNPAYGDKSFHSLPGNTGTSLGKFGGDGGDHNPDGRPQEEKREKKWETWVRPGPRAKSSFFPKSSKNDGEESPVTSGMNTAPTMAQPQPGEPMSYEERQSRCRSLSSCLIRPNATTALEDVARGSIPHSASADETRACSHSPSHKPTVTCQDSQNPSDSVETGPATDTTWSGSRTRAVWTPASALSGDAEISTEAMTIRESKSERPTSLPVTNADMRNRVPFDGALARPEKRRVLSPAPGSSTLEERLSSLTGQMKVRRPLSRQSRPTLSLRSSRSATVSPRSPKAQRSPRSPTDYLRPNQMPATNDTLSESEKLPGARGHIFDGRKRRDTSVGDVVEVIDPNAQVHSSENSLNLSCNTTSPFEGVAVKRGSVYSEQSSVGMAGVKALYQHGARQGSVGAGSASFSYWNKLSISNSENSETTGHSMGSADNDSPLSRLRARTTFFSTLSPHTEESRNNGIPSGLNAKEEHAVVKQHPEQERRVVRVTRRYRSLSPRSLDKDKSMTSGREADQDKAGEVKTTAAKGFPLGYVDQLKKYGSLSPKTRFSQKGTAKIGGLPVRRGGTHERRDFRGQWHRDPSYPEHGAKRIAKTPAASSLVKKKHSSREILHVTSTVTRNDGTTEVNHSVSSARVAMRQSPPPVTSHGKFMSTAGAHSNASWSPVVVEAEEVGAADGSRKYPIYDAVGTQDIQARARSEDERSPPLAGVVVRRRSSGDGDAGSVSDTSRAPGVRRVSEGGREIALMGMGMKAGQPPAMSKVWPKRPSSDGCETIPSVSEGAGNKGRRPAVKQGWEKRFPSGEDSRAARG